MTSCLNRAGIIGLSLLIAVTSETGVMGTLLVRAEEEENQQCVITSFMPLPENIATQTVCVGTALEELQYPDTLEVTIRYEEAQEDFGEKKPEEGDTPEKENQEDKKQPEKPEQDDSTGEEDQSKDKADEKSEEGDSKLPEDQTEDKKPEEQEKDKESEDTTGNINPENPKDEEQLGKTPADDSGTDAPSGEEEQAAEEAGDAASLESAGTAMVYVDMLNDILSKVEDKVVALFDHVTVEENQIMLVSNMAGGEQESDMQMLTQTDIIESVIWDCISEYDRETEGCYVFTPVLPEGYILADGVTAPEIVIIVSGQEIKSSVKASKDVQVLAEEKSPVSGNCGSGVVWSYDNSTGTLKIAGSGSMNNFSDLDTPWRAYQGEIRSIVVESGVTSIGNYAFFKCYSLSEVSIPDSMTSIGEAAFFECSSLGGITIPNSVTTIGGSAFFNCSSLSRVGIPSGSTIDSLAFFGCSGVTHIEVPTGAAVAATAFEGCSRAFLYYPKSSPTLGTTDGTRANIAYAVAGGNTSLEIARTAADLGNINFPDKIGGGTVWESNWNKYPAIEITHDGLEHRYADGSSECAICGYQKAPEIRIDFINEILTGFVAGKAYSYSVAGGASGTFAADAARTMPINESWLGKTISIAVQGNANVQELSIPTRDPAPTGITAQDVSAAGNDGKLLGVSSDMEWSTKEDTDYKHVTGDSVEELPAGTYYVRYQAVAGTDKAQGKFHSLSVEVIVEAHKLNPEEMPDAGIDYENETLINLTGGAKYQIGIRGTAGMDYTAKKIDGSIRIEEPWFGKTVSIIRTGDGKNTEDSAEQSLFIPRRPAAPANIGKTDVSTDKADGTLTGVTSDMVYRLAGSDKWLEITGTIVHILKPGRYEIRYKATKKKFASENATVIVASADRKKENIPKVEINFGDETLTGFTAGAIYQINDDEIEPEAKTIPLEEDWIGSTLYIIKVGDQINTNDSDAQELVIPAKPAAPEEVEAKSVTTVGKNDGKLVNVDKTMQYRREADEEDEEEEEPKEIWTPVSGTEVTKLPPGTYFIRIKATKNSFCSEAVERIVQEAEMQPEDMPRNVAIDYKQEKLEGLTKNAKYAICDQDGGFLTDDDIKADKNGKIAIDESWMREEYVGIVKIGNQFSTEDSEPFKLFIPERPGAPEEIMAVKESGKGAKNGSLLNVTSDMQYQKENAKDWTNIKGQEVNKLAPGVYYVRYRANQAEKKFASTVAEYTIMAYERQQEPEPAAYISYAEGRFVSLEPRAVYKIGGTNVKADENGEIKIRDSWLGKTVTIVRPGDGVTTSDSPKQEIEVPKKRPAPSGIQAVAESGKDKKDGKLTGVNEEMEYRQTGGGEWNPIAKDPLENLAPGEYAIRYMYTADDFASVATKKTIYAYGTEPETPAQEKNDVSQFEDPDKEQSDSTDGQSDSSQNDDGTSGGAAAGNKATVSKNEQEAAVATQDSCAVETQADESSQPEHIQDSSDNKFIGTAIADSEKDGKGSDGNADGGQLTGDTDASVCNKGEDTGAAQLKSDTETKETGKESRSDSVVYTEYAADRMSEFYEFVLNLANSRNLGWIAIILAEPIIFLLILIYLLGRKSREKECQAEH